MRTFKRTLNKFHFRLLLCFLIPLLPCFSASPLFETVVKPDVISIGDTVSVKVSRVPGENDLPKIFFDKTKMPVFKLSETWYRTLLPVSAYLKAGTYPLEIFYKEED